MAKFNSVVLGCSLIYIILSAYFIWNDQAYFTLAPIGLLGIYFAIYYTEYTFLALAFLTPLSINIEEYTDGLGLYVPTEPLLFGLLLLLLMQQTQKKVIKDYVWKNPIVWAVGFYLFWMFITAITSTAPITSFKFLLSRIWFIVPLLLFGPQVFSKLKNIRLFIWLFCISLSIVIVYTLIVHSEYSFGEKEGHWVMWPFFKDHTIYGAIVAFTTPLVFGLYFSKRQSPILKVVLIILILLNLTGLYYSSTRAAWFSIILSLIVLLIIKLKIKIQVVVGIAAISVVLLYNYWDNMKMELERVKVEHTTEEFGEKFQSATNVTTDASNLERLNRWSCAMEMFKEKPILGFGPGTYAFEYARFQHPDNLTIISTNFGDLGNAHSEYLGPLSEMGLLGFVSIVLIVLAIFYKGITLYLKWPEKDQEIRTLLLAMILSLVTYFTHGVLNNFLDTDKAAIPIWCFCAAFIALEEVLKKRKRDELLLGRDVK